MRNRGSLSRWLLLLLAVPVHHAAAQPDPLAARTKGSATAPVTVYEMSDFQCPFCKQHAEQTFQALDKEYVATGKVRWIFINLPIPALHANAVAAAEFAMCSARAGKFWPAHDLLFRLQQVWAPLKNPAPFLLGLADSLKLPGAALKACLEQHATAQEVRDDAQGAATAGATSTPSFYIEGGMLSGALPATVWRPILDSVYAAKVKKP